MAQLNSSARITTNHETNKNTYFWGVGERVCVGGCVGGGGGGGGGGGWRGWKLIDGRVAVLVSIDPRIFRRHILSSRAITLTSSILLGGL